MDVGQLLYVHLHMEDTRHIYSNGDIAMRTDADAVVEGRTGNGLYLNGSQSADLGTAG